VGLGFAAPAATVRGAKEMNEGRSDISTPQGPESVESIALAGAAAIQQIIAERDSLRTRLGSQQRDMMALGALNEELRRQLTLIRHHYVEFGTRILAQLEQFDHVIRDTIGDHQTPKVAADDDTNLVALAHRLKPNNGPPKAH
jgi:hypothetical protein